MRFWPVFSISRTSLRLEAADEKTEDGGDEADDDHPRTHARPLVRVLEIHRVGTPGLAKDEQKKSKTNKINKVQHYKLNISKFNTNNH